MLHLLDPNDDTTPFPEVTEALRQPDGLLAVGGCLSSRRLLNAYRHGIFPWYSDGEPILWWSPDPRLVLFPERMRISRSLRKTLRRGVFRVTTDAAFRQVMQACAEPRSDGAGTWITGEMIEAYVELHARGYAHSVEAWCGERLVGGVYGVALGQVFFGESMFSRMTDASKVALAHLVDRLLAWGYRLVDCQVRTDHLLSLGAEEIPRARFAELLRQWCDLPSTADAWHAPELVP